MKDWFKDKNGKIVLVQFPNWQLFGFGVFAITARLVSNDTAQQAASFTASMLLIWWAYSEIKHGVNKFRRALGAVIMVLTFASLIATII